MPESPSKSPSTGWLLATSKELAALPGLQTLLGWPVVHRSAAGRRASARGVVAWGRKPSADQAEALAVRLGLPLTRLEDGFLRSVSLGKEDPPLSIVVDDLGVYYDASTPSRLEALITAPLSDAERERSAEIIRRWCAARVSKYNHAREPAAEVLEGDGRPYVLVVDQTLGDAAIRFGGAEAASFPRMLAAALAENPECRVLLKVHPEVMAGRKRGHFDLQALSADPRVQVLGDDCHPAALIERAAAIYVVTSQMGFEGLLWGRPVRTFGMPFYAGWGLTQDELPAPPRRRPVALEALVHAALVGYPRYLDPETGARCEVERVLDWMGLQRRMRGRFPARVYALGFSLYKRPIVRGFFQGSEVRFVGGLRKVPRGGTLAVWGRRPQVAENPLVAEAGLRLVHLEDGFIRSVGLGADLIRPVSWVMDGLGIYFDATRPSDLESLLAGATFDAETLARAARLRERFIADRVTKYNLSGRGWRRPAGDRRVILVAGQVESDASIAWGAPGVRRNLELLRQVREAEPAAYIVYKPHPDVVAGLRKEGRGEWQAARWCDEMVVDTGMGELLPLVDEVQVMTSLTGFEALLRGKRVVCHGQPFYAGWGLTEDAIPHPSRGRTLTLDELVAGALIFYPTYISRITGRFTTPERALDELLAWRKEETRLISRLMRRMIARLF